MNKAVITFAIALSLGGGAAFAEGTDSPGIDQREQRQEQRIQQGIQSGALTQGEAARRQGQLDRIEAREEKMKEDGKLTRGERRRLHQQLDNSSRKIYRDKHNRKEAQ